MGIEKYFTRSNFEVNFLKLEHFDKNTLRELVSQRYRQQPFSEKFDLNFLETVVHTFVNTNYFPHVEINKFSLKTIVDYLERTHKLYLYKRMPEIEQTISILRSNYERTHPCLFILDVFFHDYFVYLKSHINKEEKELFSYVKKLIAIDENKSAFHSLAFEEKYNLNEFIDGHNDTEKDIMRVMDSIKEYQPSQTNKSPYRVLLTQLKMFQLDLAVHSQIEEKVLLPKAVELEKKVFIQIKKTVSQN